MERTWVIRVVAGGLIAGIAGCAPVASRAPIGPQGGVVLDRQTVPPALPMLRVTPGAGADTDAVKSVIALADALGIKVTQSQLTLRKEGKADVVRFHGAGHKFRVFRVSGALTYRSEALYRLAPSDAGSGPPPREAVMRQAGADLERLTRAGLIDVREIDQQNVHVTYRKTQAGERGAGRAKIGTAVTLDTRVEFIRQVGPLRVAGNGVRLIYANDGRLLGTDVVWRRVAVAEPRHAMAVSRDEAVQLFRDRVDRDLRAGSVVDLLQAELVYLDPKPRAPLAVMEPLYLFMYRVRTLRTDVKDEYVVGKKRFVMLPALKPGRSGAGAEVEGHLLSFTSSYDPE